MGVRYKCSVLKDFDFCELCEERKDHEYPFIKINDPLKVPEAIVTVLKEDTEEKSTFEEKKEEKKEEREDDPGVLIGKLV